MSVAKVVVHTDVLIDHLCGLRRPSVLRQAMSRYFCYTTVFQAIELFGLARSARERRAVEDVLSAMKLLGVNPRGARRYGDLLSRRRGNAWNILIAGLCLESRLPLLTDRRQEFAGFRGLEVLPTSVVGRRHGL